MDVTSTKGENKTKDISQKQNRKPLLIRTHTHGCNKHKGRKQKQAHYTKKQNRKPRRIRIHTHGCTKHKGRKRKQKHYTQTKTENRGGFALIHMDVTNKGRKQNRNTTQKQNRKPLRIRTHTHGCNKHKGRKQNKNTAQTKQKNRGGFAFIHMDVTSTKGENKTKDISQKQNRKPLLIRTHTHGCNKHKGRKQKQAHYTKKQNRKPRRIRIHTHGCTKHKGRKRKQKHYTQTKTENRGGFALIHMDVTNKGRKQNRNTTQKQNRKPLRIRTHTHGCNKHKGRNEKENITQKRNTAALEQSQAQITLLIKDLIFHARVLIHR
jgi:hypothetical protein